jgi:hypothetical protein
LEEGLNSDEVLSNGDSVGLVELKRER